MKSPADDTPRQQPTQPFPTPRKSRETKLRLAEQRLPNGKVRWMLSGLYVGGKRKREFFTSEDAGKRRVQMLELARKNTGTLAERIAKKPEHATDAARAADLLAPFGLSLVDAVREYVGCREALAGTGASLADAVAAFTGREELRRHSFSLDALCERFMDDPETRKKSKAYLDDVRKRWRRFADDLGPETLACDVTPETVRQWLYALPVADVTKGNFHRTVGAVFSHAVYLGWVPENPFRRVKKPDAKGKDAVAVFTPDQMKRLLLAAPEAWLPVLAVGAFAGLRPEELRRLQWEEVDLKGGFIEVKASKSKTKKRRLVTISENLRAWLQPYAGETGPVVKPNERKMRLAAMAGAGIEEWPMDVLRHSFASYHLAAGKDINATALELGHTTTKTLFQHYREAVKPEAARQWWALMPPKKAGRKVIPFKAVA